MLRIRNRFQPILDLQKEAIEKKGILPQEWNVYEAIIEKKYSDHDVKRRLFNLVVFTISRDLCPIARVYYQKYFINKDKFFWEMTLVKPSTLLFKNGDAKHQISGEYDLLLAASNPNISVIANNIQGFDFGIFFYEKYSNIPQLINGISTFKNQITNKSKMKDGTKNIIAACIMVSGLILASIIYAYSTRYTIISDKFGYGKKIDNWSGTYVKLKEVEK